MFSDTVVEVSQLSSVDELLLEIPSFQSIHQTFTSAVQPMEIENSRTDSIGIPILEITCNVKVIGGCFETFVNSGFV